MSLSNKIAGPLPSPPTPACNLSAACGSGVRGFEVLGVWEWVRSFNCQKINWTVTSRFTQAVCGGKSIFLVDLVYVRPSIHDRRCVQHSEQSLELGKQAWSLGNFHFLMFAVRPSTKNSGITARTQSRVHGVTEAYPDRGRLP